MQIALVPKPWTAAEKRAIKAWLEVQLRHAEFGDAASRMPPCLHYRLGIYLNGEFRGLIGGYWNSGDFMPLANHGNVWLNVGLYRVSNAPAKAERLGVLGAIIGAVGLWDALTPAYREAISRVVLDSYQSCFHDMVEAPQPAVKLAFSADKQQAALQYQGDDAWYLGNGEKAPVDESWMQVAA